MNEKSVVDTFLHELGQMTEMPGLHLDENHLCSLSYKGKFEVMMMSPPESETLYLASGICTIDEERKLELYEKVLEMNFLLMDTNGAAFSIDKESGRVVLCFARPLKDLDATGFVNVVGGFLESSEKLQREMTRFLGAGEEQNASQSEIMLDHLRG